MDISNFVANCLHICIYISLNKNLGVTLHGWIFYLNLGKYRGYQVLKVANRAAKKTDITQQLVPRHKLIDNKPQ